MNQSITATTARCAAGTAYVCGSCTREERHETLRGSLPNLPLRLGRHGPFMGWQQVLPHLCRRRLSRTLRLRHSAHPALVESAPFTPPTSGVPHCVWKPLSSCSSRACFRSVPMRQVGRCRVCSTEWREALCLCLIQGGLQLPVLVWMAVRRCRRSGSAMGRCTFSPLAQRQPHASRLSDRGIAFALGKSRQDTFLRATFVPKQPVILLLHGPGRWGSLFQYRIACGWTDEMRRIWSAFLTLAALPSA